jgi:hypothetical protein
MPDLNTFGVRESLHDLGWALRYGYANIASAALAPTASTPAIWVIYNSNTSLIIEGVRVSTDTALTMTLAYKVGDPGLTQLTTHGRNTGLQAAQATAEAQVTAVPSLQGTWLTQPMQAASYIDILAGNWLYLANGWSALLYSPPVAANVTATIFYRAF